MIQNQKVNHLLVESGKGKSKQIDANNQFIYFTDFTSRVQYAFEYSGLRRWLRDFVQSVVKKTNIELTTTADSKVLIPKGSWVKGIRAKGSATGITIGFNGKSYSITSATTGHEIQPRTQYVASDIDLTVTATSWGKLEIIVFI